MERSVLPAVIHSIGNFVPAASGGILAEEKRTMQVPHINLKGPTIVGITSHTPRKELGDLRELTTLQFCAEEYYFVTIGTILLIFPGWYDSMEHELCLKIAQKRFLVCHLKARITL
jgi:hypothetical protein